MEDEISMNAIDFNGSRVICRSGNPLLKHDLDTVRHLLFLAFLKLCFQVSVGSARCIIVLADDDSPDQSDARVLRIVLSLSALHESGTLQARLIFI